MLHKIISFDFEEKKKIKKYGELLSTGGQI
jgi:hypothetical protein